MLRNNIQMLNKLLLVLIRIIPMLMAACFIADSLGYFYGYNLVIANYIGGSSILTIIFLYIASYRLRFCSYHRVPLHYLVIGNCVGFYDDYVGLPVGDVYYAFIQLTILMVFVLLYIYLRFRL